ncbi:MAG TPA: hypothetical protein VK994_06855, partial [Bacteroidales bacterium]|nr:hypothetical protein [Bacteroidales bacterium]
AGGDPHTLTNGVQGAHDFAVHWLGWWGEDATITVDLETPTVASEIEIGTLWDGRSWILHPSVVRCLVSSDNLEYKPIGEFKEDGDQHDGEVTKKYTFRPGGMPVRYVRFEITGAGPLPKWHASEGEPSWFFVDEISVY